MFVLHFFCYFRSRPSHVWGPLLALSWGNQQCQDQIRLAKHMLCTQSSRQLPICDSGGYSQQCSVAFRAASSSLGVRDERDAAHGVKLRAMSIIT